MPEEYIYSARLWVLLIVPVIWLVYLKVAWRKFWRNSSNSPNDKLKRILPKQVTWKNHVTVVFSLLSLAALIVAFSGPKGYDWEPRNQATVVVTIDVSLSMEATDVKPNRIEAAKEGAIKFTESLPDSFNVSLVAFSGAANIVVPPTMDHAAIVKAIENLSLRPSTAIGEAIYTSLDALKLSTAKLKGTNKPAPGAIVLLSDGGTNTGRESDEAAVAAKKMNVPIYTIAYGTARGYVQFGGYRQRVPVNHFELYQVAKKSGGKKFSAESATELNKVYKTIARSVGYVKVYKEITERYIGISLLLAVLAALGVVSIGVKWP